MHTISRDAPCYYLTSVSKNRLPVFRTDAIKEVACKAVDEAHNSGGFALYAYVIMPDHLHLITDSKLTTSNTARYVNGIVARRVLDYLKTKGFQSSLEKLRHETWENQHKYSLWDKHPNTRLLWNEEMLMQRVHYTHQNPVRAGLVERAEDYFWSSWRYWNRKTLEREPIKMDLDKIAWRS